ncbi:MAG: hypothetical protein IBX50_09620 [Marinospirillum sp.]|uniref:hypothetical protein n=1 Tax=Marinospirillum sp. TaxID=2183934 RepID=UPI0019EEA375|nr:hypothetical protein [Marinospirillum sp.]MBE0506960.1 hypothetical protein [Marinospirillum sp.]
MASFADEPKKLNESTALRQKKMQCKTLAWAGVAGASPNPLGFAGLGKQKKVLMFCAFEFLRFYGFVFISNKSITTTESTYTRCYPSDK